MSHTAKPLTHGVVLIVIPRYSLEKIKKEAQNQMGKTKEGKVALNLTLNLKEYDKLKKEATERSIAVNGYAKFLLFEALNKVKAPQ